MYGICHDLYYSAKGRRSDYNDAGSPFLGIPPPARRAAPPARITNPRIDKCLCQCKSTTGAGMQYGIGPRKGKIRHRGDCHERKNIIASEGYQACNEECPARPLRQIFGTPRLDANRASLRAAAPQDLPGLLSPHYPINRSHLQEHLLNPRETPGFASNTRHPLSVKQTAAANRLYCATFARSAASISMANRSLEFSLAAAADASRYPARSSG